MDIEERMSKAESEIAALKDAQRLVLHGQAELRTTMNELRSTMEHGFSEQGNTIERGFSEERAARDRSIAELRQEMQRSFRWTFSAVLSILALVLGIIAKLAGYL